jgi:hypothetical protein
VAHLSSHDIFNVTHQVWLPARGAGRPSGTLLVRWSAVAEEDQETLF